MSAKLELEAGSLTLEENSDELLAHLTELLEDGENCIAWEKLLNPVDDDEMSIILSTMNGRLENALKGSEDIEGLILFGGCEMIASRCIQAYIYSVKKQVQDALDVIKDTMDLLSECVDENKIPEGYVRGIRYVLKSLEVIAFGLSDNPQYMGPKDLKKYVKTLEKYAELKGENLIGLNAVKYYFMWNMSHKSYKTTRAVVEQLIGMDPENPQWHAVLYLNYKFERQQGDKGRVNRMAATYSQDAPSELEIQALRTAVSCPGADTNVTVLTYNLMCLAEMFRCKVNEVRIDGIKNFVYGDLNFESAENVVEYLRREATKSLSLNDNSVRTLFVISRAFSSGLPYKFRDLDFADSCITTAVNLYPTVSKVNHRKGIVCIQKGNWVEGSSFLTKAYRLDPRNVNALVDALFASIPLTPGMDVEVQSLAEDAFNSVFVQNDANVLSQILFIVGIYEIATGKSSEGVKKLVASIEGHESKSVPHFQHLFREMKRFGWRMKEDFRIATIKKKFFEAVNSELAVAGEDSSEKSNLEKLLQLMKEAQPLNLARSNEDPRDGDRDRRPRQRDNGHNGGRHENGSRSQGETGNRRNFNHERRPIPKQGEGKLANQQNFKNGDRPNRYHKDRSSGIGRSSSSDNVMSGKPWRGQNADSSGQISQPPAQSLRTADCRNWRTKEDQAE